MGDGWLPQENTDPWTKRPVRLVKLALRSGTQQEGAVHASVRKGLAMGITTGRAGTGRGHRGRYPGLPRTVAAYTWIRDLL